MPPRGSVPRGEHFLVGSNFALRYSSHVSARSAVKHNINRENKMGIYEITLAASFLAPIAILVSALRPTFRITSK